MSKAEKEKLKLIQDKCQTMLNDMLRDEDNKYCVDCDAKGPRWASWNLGIYLCIRCAGIHRNLGVHISKVKSVNLDTWTPEQVMSMTGMGNSKGRAVYEANLPDNFRRPQTDVSLENFIRAKYEHKKYIAKEWVASPRPTKVDWSAEIEEQIHQKNKNFNNKKKTAGLTVVGKPPTTTTTTTTTKSITNVPPSTLVEEKEPKTIDLFDGLDLNPPPPPPLPSSQIINNTNLLSNELESLFLDQPTNTQTEQQQKMTNTHILSLYSSSSSSNNQQNVHPPLFLQQGQQQQLLQQSQPPPPASFNLFWKQ